MLLTAGKAVIFPRTTDILCRLSADGRTPCIDLAHSSSYQSRDFARCLIWNIMAYSYPTTQIPDLFNVKGKVALITGGSSGLGLNMAHGLVRNGCRVYISSRKQAQCDAAVKELSPYGEAYAIACNASKKADLDSLAAKIAEREPNGVHFCIANAGATWGEGIDSHPESAFSKVMDLNVKSVFYTVQVMLPLLEKAATAQDPARVITTGSVAGLRVSSPGIIPYSTSKAAVHHLIRNMSVVLGERHITANAIAPGRSCPSLS